MGKMISTTEVLSELLAEEDCANTEPADAASKGRRVRCAMVIRFPECRKLGEAAGASIIVELTTELKTRDWGGLSVSSLGQKSGVGLVFYLMT